jgi:hypothetical protein
MQQLAVGARADAAAVAHFLQLTSMLPMPI